MHRQLGNVRRWRRAGHARARTRAGAAAGRVLGGTRDGHATPRHRWARARLDALRRQDCPLPWLLPALASPGPAGALDAYQAELGVVQLGLGSNLAL